MVDCLFAHHPLVPSALSTISRVIFNKMLAIPVGITLLLLVITGSSEAAVSSCVLCDYNDGDCFDNTNWQFIDCDDDLPCWWNART